MGSVVETDEHEDDIYLSADDCHEQESPETRSLLHLLPDDLVVMNVWPRVLSMSSAKEICQYRLISTHWRVLVGKSSEWTTLKPLLVGTDARPPWYDLGLHLDDLMYLPEYLTCEYHRAQEWYDGLI